MTKMHKKLKVSWYQVIGIAVLCISIIYLIYNTTLAWFTDSSTTSTGDPGVLIVGTIDLDVQTDFSFRNKALAPDTIYTTEGSKDYGTYIRTSDKNNIRGVYVRVKFYCSRPDEVSLYFDSENFTDSISYSSSLEGKWVYDGEVDASGYRIGYYYYLGQINDTFEPFNAGYKVENNLHNAIATERVDMNFTVEAIQSQYGAVLDDEIWPTAPPIFYEFVNQDQIT